MQFRQCQELRDIYHYGAGFRAWYLAQVRPNSKSTNANTILILSGPAHAVYFATYEVVKQAMGGNASGHHPLAAGRQQNLRLAGFAEVDNNYSYQRRMCNNCKRCLHEPI